MLDERLDQELVKLNQELYRFIPTALAGHSNVPVDDEGIPDAVRYYLLYTSAVIYGAADAALTLTLHNLGREARIVERQIFESYVRSVYYAANPGAARLALLAVPREERRLLDELGYEKNSTRYGRVLQEERRSDQVEPGSRNFREPTLKQILDSPDNDGLRRMYAINYRVSSLIAHASFLGIGNVLSQSGMSFDSREKLANFGITTTTVCLLAFLELLNAQLNLEKAEDIATFAVRWKSMQPRVAALES